jgi:hypothetical protein
MPGHGADDPPTNGPGGEGWSALERGVYALQFKESPLAIAGFRDAIREAKEAVAGSKFYSE